jgi:mannose-6-phosphate isomerase
MGVKDETNKRDSVKDIRPWGNFVQYAHNEKCTVKIIEVNQGQRLSNQSHEKRDELWVILDRDLRVELDDRVIDTEPGDEIVIERNTKHRLSSIGGKARLLEISFGDFDENDIIRFDDDYGRIVP